MPSDFASSGTPASPPTSTPATAAQPKLQRPSAPPASGSSAAGGGGGRDMTPTPEEDGESVASACSSRRNSTCSLSCASPPSDHASELRAGVSSQAPGGGSLPSCSPPRVGSLPPGATRVVSAPSSTLDSGHARRGAGGASSGAQPAPPSQSTSHQPAAECGDISLQPRQQYTSSGRGCAPRSPRVVDGGRGNVMQVRPTQCGDTAPQRPAAVSPQHLDTAEGAEASSIASGGAGTSADNGASGTNTSGEGDRSPSPQDASRLSTAAGAASEALAV